MDKIEKIKKRIEIGYTMSVYGTKENLYWTMRKDMQTLMLHIDKQKLPIDLVSKRELIDDVKETLYKYKDYVLADDKLNLEEKQLECYRVQPLIRNLNVC